MKFGVSNGGGKGAGNWGIDVRPGGRIQQSSQV